MLQAKLAESQKSLPKLRQMPPSQEQAYQKQLWEQNEIIERLAMKMQAHGVELDDADFLPPAQ